MQIGIEIAVPFKNGPPQEESRLANETHVLQARKMPGFCRVAIDDAVVGRNVIRHPIDGVQLRMCGQEVGCKLNRTRIVDVIGVKPADDIATSHLNTLVDRVGLPFVGLGYPSELSAVLLQNVESAVGAAAVEYDVL